MGYSHKKRVRYERKKAQKGQPAEKYGIREGGVEGLRPVTKDQQNVPGGIAMLNSEGGISPSQYPIASQAVGIDPPITLFGPKRIDLKRTTRWTITNYDVKRDYTNPEKLRVLEGGGTIHYSSEGKTARDKHYYYYVPQPGYVGRIKLKIGDRELVFDDNYSSAVKIPRLDYVVIGSDNRKEFVVNDEDIFIAPQDLESGVIPSLNNEEILYRTMINAHPGDESVQRVLVNHRFSADVRPYESLLFSVRYTDFQHNVEHYYFNYDHHLPPAVAPTTYQLRYNEIPVKLVETGGALNNTAYVKITTDHGQTFELRGGGLKTASLHVDTNIVALEGVGEQSTVSSVQNPGQPFIAKHRDPLKWGNPTVQKVHNQITSHEGIKQLFTQERGEAKVPILAGAIDFRPNTIGIVRILENGVELPLGRRTDQQYVTYEQDSIKTLVDQRQDYRDNVASKFGYIKDFPVLTTETIKYRYAQAKPEGVLHLKPDYVDLDNGAIRHLRDVVRFGFSIRIHPVGKPANVYDVGKASAGGYPGYDFTNPLNDFNATVQRAKALTRMGGLIGNESDYVVQLTFTIRAANGQFGESLGGLDGASVAGTTIREKLFNLIKKHRPNALPPIITSPNDVYFEYYSPKSAASLRNLDGGPGTYNRNALILRKHVKIKNYTLGLDQANFSNLVNLPQGHKVHEFHMDYFYSGARRLKRTPSAAELGEIYGIKSKSIYDSSVTHTTIDQYQQYLDAYKGYLPQRYTRTYIDIKKAPQIDNKIVTQYPINHVFYEIEEGEYDAQENLNTFHLNPGRHVRYNEIRIKVEAYLVKGIPGNESQDFGNGIYRSIAYVVKRKDTGQVLGRFVHDMLYVLSRYFNNNSHPNGLNISLLGGSSHAHFTALSKNLLQNCIVNIHDFIFLADTDFTFPMFESGGTTPKPESKIYVQVHMKFGAGGGDYDNPEHLPYEDTNEDFVYARATINNNIVVRNYVMDIELLSYEDWRKQLDVNLRKLISPTEGLTSKYVLHYYEEGIGHVDYPIFSYPDPVAP